MRKSRKYEFNNPSRSKTKSGTGSCTAALKPSAGPYLTSLSSLSERKPALRTKIAANQERNQEVRESVWGKNICFDVL